MYVGGAGVARGYLGRPGLTAARFVPDPVGGAPGARLYRTGDRARRRADGALEFLGRLDAQVKVRGHRVEPAEIEATLARQPGVRAAAVAVREDAAGERRLVAYVVAEPGHALAAGALRERLRDGLRAWLPEYMLPSQYVPVDALPLTPNGKLDRAALPAPPSDGQEAEGDAPPDYVAPRTSLERRLAAIWVDVLAIDHVGVHDDFFDLGGHSLLATRVASRIREALALDLPLRWLFELPTIAGLASRIEETHGSAAAAAVPTDDVHGAEQDEGEVLRALAELEELSDEEARRALERTMHDRAGHGTEGPLEGPLT